MENLVKQIETILQPLSNKGFYTFVNIRKTLGEEYILFGIASSDKTINNVPMQYPDFISFRLSADFELTPQHINCSGGQCISRNINPNEPKEKYLAMKGEKVPFRKPQQNEVAVMKAITKLTDNYIKTLNNIKDMGLLRYNELVNYDELLS